MAINWVAAIIYAVISYAVQYLITPRPEGPGNEAIGELENPTADAGRPVPVLFGTMTIKSANILWFGDKFRRIYEKDVGGSKK